MTRPRPALTRALIALSLTATCIALLLELRA